MQNTAAPSDKIILNGLARYLVREGLIEESIALDAYEKSHEEKIPLASYLVEHKILKSDVIAVTASREFGIPLFNLQAIELEQDTVSLVKESLIRKHNALPLFKRGSRLYVALSDPTNLPALDEIKFNTGLNTEPVLAEDDKLRKAIERALDHSANSMDAFAGDDNLEDLDMSDGPDSGESSESSEVDDTPIVRFVNKVLLDAIKVGASDIHFEPYEKKYRVRTRSDGVLREIVAPPVNMAMKIAARLKVMSRLDISERRVPQDGRMKMTISKNRSIDFRVSTCPTLFGEKIVIRILDPTSAQMGIDALGYEPEQKELYMKALEQPQGMILVTGPTGSGKTVSLYTGLNILNTEDRNISTAEDPAEINLPGVNQVNVNPRAGLTFAAALKSFLRQDPDIIMVGEIRDLETAEIAIKAAQTGHMVMSTLHTNDAPQTLTRLANMGIPGYNIAATVSLIIAQRLARKLCKECKTPIDIPKEALLKEGFTKDQLKEDFTIYAPKGCDQCTAGYKGRVGIYQVMPITEAMGRLIMEGANSIALGDQAEREGVNDLRKSGLKKIMDGVTSLEEVMRVTTE
ncbi:MAG: type IV-A pilus assembly ATPase PilB [Thiotrichales bacterium]|nr:type IV-A pilus assembly ATPase PilB [Thiotrichales bacterium]